MLRFTKFRLSLMRFDKLVVAISVILLSPTSNDFNFLEYSLRFKNSNPRPYFKEFS